MSVAFARAKLSNVLVGSCEKIAGPSYQRRPVSPSEHKVGCTKGRKLFVLPLPPGL